MTLTITVSESTERELAGRATATGRTVEALASELLEAVVWKPKPAHEQTFAEILAPVRAGVEEGDVTEEEIDELVEQVREEIWQEKHGYPSKQPAAGPEAADMPMVILNRTFP